MPIPRGTQKNRRNSHSSLCNLLVDAATRPTVARGKTQPKGMMLRGTLLKIPPEMKGKSSVSTRFHVIAGGRVTDVGEISPLVAEI